MTNYNDGYPSISVLRRHFYYDWMSGDVFSNSNRRNVRCGDLVGSFDRQGYLVTSLFKKPMNLHRVAWALFYGEWPNGLIDHKNGVKDDNRISNLRVVTNAQNKQNQNLSSANTSGFLGVSWHKKSGKWAANIKLNGKAKHLGTFCTPEAASDAYLAAKRELHPFNEVCK